MDSLDPIGIGAKSLSFWDEGSLLIGNEGRELYEIKASALMKLQL